MGDTIHLYPVANGDSTMPVMVFLDDTGGSVHEINQPIVALCGLYVSNANLVACHDEMAMLRSDVGEMILKRAATWLGSTQKKAGYKFGLAKQFMSDYVSGRFELHAGPLFKGNEAFEFLPAGERFDVFKTVIQMVEKYDFFVVGAAIEKLLVNQDATLSKDEKELRMGTILVENTVRAIDDFATQRGDHVFLIADQGNAAIQKNLDNMLKSLRPTNIMNQAVQYSSFAHPLIQLADHCAYVLSLYYRQMLGTNLSAADKVKATQLYNMMHKRIRMAEQIPTLATGVAQVAAADKKE